MCCVYYFSARQDNDDQYSTEIEKLKYTLLHTQEEKKRLEDELFKVRVLVGQFKKCGQIKTP